MHVQKEAQAWLTRVGIFYLLKLKELFSFLLHRSRPKVPDLNYDRNNAKPTYNKKIQDSIIPYIINASPVYVVCEKIWIFYNLSN